MSEATGTTPSAPRPAMFKDRPDKPIFTKWEHPKTGVIRVYANTSWSRRVWAEADEDNHGFYVKSYPREGGWGASASEGWEGDAFSALMLEAQMEKGTWEELLSVAEDKTGSG